MSALAETSTAMSEVDKLTRRLARERGARVAAEAVAERGLRELYEKQEQLRLLEEIANNANQSACLDDALEFAITAVCRFAGYTLGHAYLCDPPASGRLSPTSIWHACEPERVQPFRILTEATPFESGAGLPGRVLAAASAAWVRDIGEDRDCPRAAAAAACGLKAAFAFPVLVRSEVTAVLEFFADKVCEPDEVLLRLMAQVGTQLGRVVERQRAEHQRIAAQANQHAHDRRRLVEESEQKIREQFMRLHTAINNISQGLAMFDASKTLVVCNSRYPEMHGLSPDDVTPGTKLQDLLERHVAKGQYAGTDPQKFIDKLLRPVTAAGQHLLRLNNGRTIVVSLQPMADGGWVTTHDDITERQQVEARIAHMAHHDALTDLPNRVLFSERLDLALSRVRRGDSLAVHCLDLDRFKAVNDTLGHAAGDKLLQMVADRLRACVRETDTVARLGGDEFAVIQSPAQAAEAALMARRLREAISAPYDLDGQQALIDASIGISVAPTDGVEAAQLLRNADIALYGAKAGGGANYCFFEPEMDASMKARRALELDLRKAIANGEFELHYQPIVHLSRGDVTSCEALVRWRHPERGMIAPDNFIPVAEETGLMVPLGAWVLRQACADAAGWPNEVRIAVNVSPSQMSSQTLVESVFAALAASRLPAHRLELEITEAVLMQNNEVTRTMLHQLRDLGVTIAMDDFGTGYSSLSYLRSFPFDKIKIDRSFIAGLPDDGDSLAIVQAIANLAKSLKMVTTAEGVETAGQRDRVFELGCTEVQGYLFSRPIPKDDIARLLSRQSGRAANAA